MTAARLYLFALCGVLCLAGCGQDRSNPSPDAAAQSAPQEQTAAVDTASSDATASAALRVLVLGNSIAAGNGLADPGTQSFPARLQQRVDSLGWNVQVQNAGLSGETSAGGLSRVGWLLSQPVDVLILELGGNDGLRGVDPSATEENLSAIVDTTLQRYPDARVLLAGMQVPPNLGQRYTEQFREIYPSIAQSYEKVTLIPFILEGVGGVDAMMQDDGIHPTAQGHRRVADTVWEVLRPTLDSLRQRS